MVYVKRVVLDVLKPHHPSAIEFARTVAQAGTGYRVHLIVAEVDEKTETLQIEISGNAIDFDDVQAVINGMGGSVHSIDEVEAESLPEQGEPDKAS